MPRHARLRISGHPLHIIQRGVNRAACFAGDSDRTLYLALLEELAGHHACAIHAYVLMTNHVHLLLSADRVDGPSTLMKHLGQRYVQHFNRKHGRTGSLWEGRFRSSIVDSEGYLLRCQCYIEMNPVRAGMVERPDDYPWSSYASNANGAPSSVLAPHELYLSLANERSERLTAYRQLFAIAPSLDELREIRDAANGGFALGRAGFLANLQRALRRRVASGVGGRPRKRTP